jgi:hypothetical protein
MTQFIILSLAIWRLCVLLQDDMLPFHLGEKFRHLIGIRYDAYSQRQATNQFAEMLLCIYCLSLWIALPFAVYFYREQFLIYWFALSGAAVIIDKGVKG